MRKILLLLVLLLPLVFLLFTSCSGEENPKIPIVDDVYEKIAILQSVQYGDELSSLESEFGPIQSVSESTQSSIWYGWEFVDKNGNRLYITTTFRDGKIIGLNYSLNHSSIEILIHGDNKP